MNATPPPLGRSFLPFVIGVPLAFALLIFILMVFQFRQVKALVSKTPMAMATLPKSDRGQAEILSKVKLFLAKEKAASDSAGDTLRITEAEANHLLRASPIIHGQEERYYLALEKDLLVLTNVIPAKDLQGPVAWMVRLFDSGGWLNSRMKGTVAMEKGQVKVNLTKAEMNGVDAPVSTFNRDNRMDPRRLAVDTANYDAYIAQLKNLRIAEGEAILIRKGKSLPGLDLGQ